MPNWLLQSLLGFLVSMVTKYGIPALEAQFPSLVPLFEALLKVIQGQNPPSDHLQASADHYNMLISKMPDTVKE